MRFDFGYVIKVFPNILSYLPITLGIAFLSGAIAMMLSVGLLALRKIQCMPLQAVLNFLSGFFSRDTRSSPAFFPILWSGTAFPYI